VATMPTIPGASFPNMDDEHIQRALVGVFKKYGFGPHDMDAIIHFAMASFEVNAYNYLVVYQALKQHLIRNFDTRHGSMCRVGELVMRRSVVFYTDPQKRSPKK